MCDPEHVDSWDMLGLGDTHSPLWYKPCHFPLTEHWETGCGIYHWLGVYLTNHFWAELIGQPLGPPSSKLVCKPLWISVNELSCKYHIPSYTIVLGLEEQPCRVFVQKYGLLMFSLLVYGHEKACSLNEALTDLGNLFWHAILSSIFRRTQLPNTQFNMVWPKISLSPKSWWMVDKNM